MNTKTFSYFLPKLLDKYANIDWKVGISKVIFLLKKNPESFSKWFSFQYIRHLLITLIFETGALFVQFLLALLITLERDKYAKKRSVVKVSRKLRK